jgi:septum site-determining protein MinD
MSGQQLIFMIRLDNRGIEMSNVLVVTSGKGGTGKTTVSYLLAQALCRRHKNVLLLELDSGLRGLDLIMGVSDKIVYDLSDVLSGRCKPVKSITVCNVPQGNLHLIPAPVDRHFVPDRTSLTALLKGLAGCYDYLILDTSAGLGRGFDVACSVCNNALIVCTADPVSVRDAAKAAQILQEKKPKLVINKFLRHILSKDLPDLDAVIDHVGAQLIAVIPEDPLVERLLAKGESLPQSSLAWREVEDMTRRILGERVRLNVERLK